MKKTSIPKQQKAKWSWYRFYQCGFFILLVLLVTTMASSYNYFIFKLLISQGYMDTDALDEIYAEAIGADHVTGYYHDFDQMIIATVTEKIRSKNDDRYTYLYKPGQYKLSKDVEEADAKTSRIEKLSEDTVYLSISNLSSYTKNFVYKNKNELQSYKNLVLDLRSDYGGLLADFYKISELFLPKDSVIGHEKTRFSFLTKAIKSKKDAFFDFEQIIILQDNDTASAAEGLILSLKQNLDHVTLVGEQTFGKGIGQIALPLTNSCAIKATVLHVSGPDDVSIHRKGIPPDIEYTEDDIVAYALSLAEDE